MRKTRLLGERAVNLAFPLPGGDFNLQKAEITNWSETFAKLQRIIILSKAKNLNEHIFSYAKILHCVPLDL